MDASREADTPSPARGAWVLDTIRRVGLPIWFVVWDVAIIFRLLWPHSVGIDGNLYSVATNAWLHGGDPWAIFDNNRLAAPPPALIPFILTSWLPGGVAGYLWVVVGLAAAIWAIRQLRLPFWWLFFPPLMNAIWHGSIEPVVLLMLVVGPRFLAPVLKLYAALPLLGEGRWKSLVAAGVILLVTAPLFPWQLYLSHWADVQVALQSEGFGIAEGLGPVTVVTALALVLLGRRRAGYVAIPALWPVAHFHYASLALPVLATLPLVAAGASMVGPPYPIQIAVILTAVLVTLGITERPGDGAIQARSWWAWVVGRWRGEAIARPRRAAGTAAPGVDQ